MMTIRIRPKMTEMAALVQFNIMLKEGSLKPQCRISQQQEIISLLEELLVPLR
jgi:hypothetical protein